MGEIMARYKPSRTKRIMINSAWYLAMLIVLYAVIIVATDNMT